MNSIDRDYHDGKDPADRQIMRSALARFRSCALIALLLSAVLFSQGCMLYLLGGVSSVAVNTEYEHDPSRPRKWWVEGEVVRPNRRATSYRTLADPDDQWGFTRKVRLHFSSEQVMGAKIGWNWPLGKEGWHFCWALGYNNSDFRISVEENSYDMSAKWLDFTFALRKVSPSARYSNDLFLTTGVGRARSDFFSDYPAYGTQRHYQTFRIGHYFNFHPRSRFELGVGLSWDANALGPSSTHSDIVYPCGGTNSGWSISPGVRLRYNW